MLRLIEGEDALVREAAGDVEADERSGDSGHEAPPEVSCSAPVERVAIIWSTCSAISS